jgi:hypothetical protein
VSVSDVPGAAVARVAALHAAVDAAVAALRARLGAALRCGVGCTACCVDDVTVFEVEAAAILAAAAADGGLPGPTGRCALLGVDGACRVYEVRPYVCRTQGLPLRWLDDADDEVVERRDVCPENDPLIDLLDLDETQCWALGPWEGRLAALQAAVDGGALRRVSLRAVAEAASGSPRR